MLTKKSFTLLVVLAVIGAAAFLLIKKHQQTSPDPWGTWVEKQTRFSIKQELAKSKRRGDLEDWTKTDIATVEEKIRSELRASAAELKKVLVEPPEPTRIVYQFEVDMNRPKPYDGPWPQTPESIMAVFDEMYNSGPHEYQVEDDAKLPRAEWFAMLLARGAVIKHYGNYSGYMSSRWGLLRAENAPEKWGAGERGIASAQDWETYQENYIDREIWRTEQLRAAKAADPRVAGGAFVGPNLENFLPFTGERTYVELFDNGISTKGVPLTNFEKFKLQFLGIAPSDVEVIYIDEDGNFLDEKPPPLTWEKILEKSVPPDSGWEQEFEKWNPPPGFMEAAKKVWGASPPSNPENMAPTDIGLETAPGEAPMSMDTFEDIFVEQVEQATASKDEKAEQSVQELSDLFSETDAEITAELEKWLTFETFSDAELEKFFREPVVSGQLTPERFEKALDTLGKYGLVEGLHKLKKSDPALALEVQRRLHQKSQLRDGEEPSEPSPAPPAFEED